MARAGIFCALTKEQETWALDNGFDEILVKTKNRFDDMRSRLDHLELNVIKFEATRTDNRDSKVYLGKHLGLEVVDRHRSTRSVMQAG